MKVNNINGTSYTTCKCGSWLDHWKNFSRQVVPNYCPTYGCIERPEVGAHVQKENSSDRSWYIVPLCKKCNAKTGGSLEIDNNISLVSANVSLTCGR